MSYWKTYIVAVLILAVVGVFSACAQSTGDSPEDAPGAIVVTDQMGRTVELASVPETIVSLSPSNTEILFALGLGDKVAGVTKYCDYPEAANQKAKVGGFSTPNIEEIVALAPDLVIAASLHETRVLPQLEAQNLTVLVLAPKTLDEVIAAITLVGRVTGAESAATDLTSAMRARMDRVIGITAGIPDSERTRVIYAVWHDPLKVAGSGTLHDGLITLAGGRNVAANLELYANMNLEDVLASNPEVMICSGSHGSGADQTFNYLHDETRLAGTPARESGCIYMIDGDLVSRGGPRLVDGLELFARFIQPDLFGE